MFFIASAFQSGNNIGIAAAFGSFVESKAAVAGLVIVFNLLDIAFMHVFDDLYKMLERVMTMFVGLMLICFAINLICLKPSVSEMAKGFLPSIGNSGEWMPIIGLIGTTFVIAGAFYQAYLVLVAVAGKTAAVDLPNQLERYFKPMPAIQSQRPTAIEQNQRIGCRIRRSQLT